MSPVLTAFIAKLGWALLHFLWQGLVVGAVAALALMVMRNARPQARYAVACAAMALCLLLPVATMLGSLSAGDAAPMAQATLPASTDTASATAQVSLADGWQQQLQPRLPLIVALWSLGAGLLAMRMALGLAWIARADRPGIGAADESWQARLDALAAKFELPRRVLLRVVEELDGPVAARVWRPVVLVPAALVARMPPDLLEALLAHELAHIKRHDYLVNLVQSAIEALLFYHPVVWWLSRQVRNEREQIADDLAAHTLGSPRRLALALDHLAQFGAPTLHLAPAAHGGSLMSRIQRLVRPRKHALNWRLALPILALSVACVSVFAQGTTPGTAPSTDPEPTAAHTTRVAPREGSEFMLVGRDRNGPSFLSANYDQVKQIDDLRSRYGGEFLWFRQDGRSYVVQDAALVAQARQAWAATEPVGKQMEALGEEMEVHGKVMEELGARMEAQTAQSEPVAAEMEELGRRMEVLGNRIEPLAEQLHATRDDAERDRLQSEMRDLTAQMEVLGAQMKTHTDQIRRQHEPLEALAAQMQTAGEPMKPLGVRMEALGTQMGELSQEATLRTHAVIDQALRDGKAIVVDGTSRQ